MTSDERLSLDERFAQIAETRRPNSLAWLAGHRERMERLRLEPDYAAYQSELLRAKVEDLTDALHALLARLSPNGQRSFGGLGQPPQARGRS